MDLRGTAPKRALRRPKGEAAPNPYALPRPYNASAGAPTAIDLFSGAGGIALGLTAAGFDVRLCADRDAACGRTHARNFPGVPFVQADVAALNGADLLSRAGVGRGGLDLLVGGPPCQGFSIIGQRELADPRNRLIAEFIRLAGEMQPRCAVMENVPGLATLGKGAALREIGRAFAEAGYEVECAELLAAQYGVPQMRWRMVFIAWRMDQGQRGGFPAPTHGRAGIGDLVPNRTVQAEDLDGLLTIHDAIGDMPPVRAGDVATAYISKPSGLFQKAMRDGAPEALANHYAPRLSPQNVARIEHLLPGQDWRSLPHDMLPAGMQRALRKDHTRRYRRMQWTGVARSIITRFRDPKSGEYIHPEQDRTISIREAARIQSFPDWFVFEGGYSEQYEQVGNAVPPLLGLALGRSIKAALSAPARMRPSVKSRYRITSEEQIPMAMA